jgi:hypothetical protein
MAINSCPMPSMSLKPVRGARPAPTGSGGWDPEVERNREMRLSRGSGVRAFDLSGSVASPSAPFSALLRLFGSGIDGLAVSRRRRAGVDDPAADRHPAALAQWLGELHISAAGLPGAWDVNDRLRAHANISKRDLATGRLIFRLGFRMSLPMGAAHAGVPAPGAFGSIAPAHLTDGRPGRSGERARSSSQ